MVFAIESAAQPPAPCAKQLGGTDALGTDVAGIRGAIEQVGAEEARCSRRFFFFF